ncbi:hypothetical protein V8G57_02590 [Collimonas sp. H4R21]|uniref:Uncharacterized protein n=1 Tax=Collimonas rhizosphaerae TaxID=3126357 RepID=A0ABU9PQK3_9BURK
MNLLTVARTSGFGQSIREHFSKVKKQLDDGSSYFSAVNKSVELSASQQLFHEATYLIGLMSIAEALLFDLAQEYLLQNPGHIKDKGLSLDMLAKSGSPAGVIAIMAEKTVIEWSYGRFQDFVKQVVTLYAGDKTINSGPLNQLLEIKATRDLYVHASGLVNELYISKAGPNIRGDRIGDQIPLGKSYLRKAEKAIKEFVVEMEVLILPKLRGVGRATALRRMWDATALAKRVPFEKGWHVLSEEMVMPNDEGLSWRWSGSEKMLVDFFLGIYNQDYPTRTHDLMSALRRWPPSTDEGKVMLSWIDNPFWF